jgi:hypothetical protein
MLLCIAKLNMPLGKQVTSPKNVVLFSRNNSSDYSAPSWTQGAILTIACLAQFLYVMELVAVALGDWLSFVIKPFFLHKTRHRCYTMYYYFIFIFSHVYKI